MVGDQIIVAYSLQGLDRESQQNPKYRVSYREVIRGSYCWELNNLTELTNLDFTS